MENIRGKKCFKNAERKKNSEVEKFGQESDVNWNHTDLILNCNQKDSDSIHIDPN